MHICACANIPTNTQTFITQEIKIIANKKILNFAQNKKIWKQIVLKLNQTWVLIFI